MKGRIVLACLLLVAPAAAHDEGMGFDPAADAGLFPDPDEVQAAIDAAADHPWITVHTVGESVAGRPIRLLEITDPQAPMPIEDRVVTFVMSQQHGNEPAGTPAALRILDQITAGTGVSAYLDEQVLLLLPQSNPDGSFAVQRANQDGTDINRDHVALTTPEARALHDVLNRWDVHMAMDHHEYGGIGLGEPVPVRIYDWDITTMMPNHGNVQPVVRDMADRLNYDHLYPRAVEAGYSIGDYGTVGVGIQGTFVPLQHTAGGPDPGILRNNYGLNNVVGLLVETFVSGQETPLQSFDRRVGAHTAVMEAVLEFGALQGQDLIETKRTAEQANRDSPMQDYIEGEVRAPRPPGYLTGTDITGLWGLHGLPDPLPTDGRWLAHADHGRGGLVSALLQPESSRSVADAQAAAAVVPHPQTGQHRDLGPIVPASEAAGPSDETTPAPAIALLLAALVLIARRR